MSCPQIPHPLDDIVYAEAVNAFVSEGGFVPPAVRATARGLRAETICRPGVSVSFPAQQTPPDDLALMRKYAISQAGGYYHYSGYRYERLRDAVAYAALVGSRSDDAPPVALGRCVPVVSESDCQRMRSLQIVADGAFFRWGTYRYDRATDAIAYATLIGLRNEAVRAAGRQR